MEARIAVLTVSDTRTRETDLSGPEAVTAFHKLGLFNVSRRVVMDDGEAIQSALIEMAQTCDLVVTTGGTGFGPRDVTPEATAQVIDRPASNLSDLIRLKGLEQTDLSYLSRGIAGMRGQCLIINLPGSPKAVRQGLAAIAHLIPPILSNLRGDGCPH